MQRPLSGRAMLPSLGVPAKKVASGGPNSQARHTPACLPLYGRYQNLRRRSDEVAPPFQRRQQNLGFAAESATEIPGICDLTLLPGGRSLLAINDDEGDVVTLHRIELEDGQASLPVVANIGLDGRPECRFV